MKDSIEAFYDDFTSRFVRDYVEGNDRVERQLRFFAAAIPPTARSILVVGCGSGEGAFFIATKVAPHATILAVDLSSESLRLATSAFNHDRITYRKVDIVAESIEGTWDFVLLPDVYEHIPRDSRSCLHRHLKECLGPQGSILLTIPSPGKQASLRESGHGLQIVDETVTVEDLLELTRDVGAALTYFNMISVWDTNDYIHAIVQRGTQPIRAIRDEDKTTVRGWPRRRLTQRAWEFFLVRTGLGRVQRWWRRRWIGRRYPPHPIG
jgi:SAM-dependent methyltransferase